ncbi:hypothetical protein TIFTF001_004735 [Ficus carica]|uniref:Uncharacterized protein n=1 Tax=Ficus carica TaxID=3494 RepID=A0AA88CTM9_FICCA|nr:hypothetical protein TIFTF001_004735 [Ficus carica]
MGKKKGEKGRNWEGERERCLGFVDARAMVGENPLALGEEGGVGRRRVAAGGVTVAGRVFSLLSQTSNFKLQTSNQSGTGSRRFWALWATIYGQFWPCQ